MKLVSLRVRLIKTLLLQLSATVILAGILALFFIYHEVDEVYDATLVQFARSLSSMPAADADPQNYAGLEPSRNAAQAHKYERKISYRIRKGNQLIAESGDAPALANDYPPIGFSDQMVNGKEWRLFILLDEKSGRTIDVAEKYEIRGELTLQLLSSLVLPGILFVIGALAAIWWGTAYGLRQLVGVSMEVNRRAADDLSPLNNSDIPVEIRPLTTALNALFRRIENSLFREREFTDNAAHELRTPLAAMKTQAQVLLKTENLSEKGRNGLDNLVASIDRATEMTEGLLSFARVQADKTGKMPVNLGAVILAEVEGLRNFAQSREIRLNINIGTEYLIQGVESALALLTRNILHNAIKFTPPKGRVDISLTKDAAGGVCLRVDDTGPGVAQQHQERIFDRFYRVDKSVASGSGLGLSIVKWVADVHGAEIRFENRAEGGLSFFVVFKS